MTLKEGATHEINSRWPEHKQRNVGISYEWYGEEYANNMTIGIQIVRDRYHRLIEDGATEWSIDQETTAFLDSLVVGESDVQFRI